ncbi:unnamed protein product, partial [Acanthoscelides obtectus]
MFHPTVGSRLLWTASFLGSCAGGFDLSPALRLMSLRQSSVNQFAVCLRLLRLASGPCLILATSVDKLLFVHPCPRAVLERTTIVGLPPSSLASSAASASWIFGVL